MLKDGKIICYTYLVYDSWRQKSTHLAPSECDKRTKAGPIRLVVYSWTTGFVGTITTTSLAKRTGRGPYMPLQVVHKRCYTHTQTDRTNAKVHSLCPRSITKLPSDHIAAGNRANLCISSYSFDRVVAHMVSVPGWIFNRLFPVKSQSSPVKFTKNCSSKPGNHSLSPMTGDG